MADSSLPQCTLRNHKASSKRNLPTATKRKMLIKSAKGAPWILKVGATELAPSLAVIRNGEWIAKLKRGEWIPVYKKDDEQRDINYRPIMVLPCLNKVYEVLLGQQVSKFMDDRLSDAITAYHAKNSCETTLIRLTETWRAELDSKKIVRINCHWI